VEYGVASVYLNLRDNTKKAADATYRVNQCSKLMQITDEATKSIVDQNQIRIVTRNSTK
jgi:hypothetical protein